MRSSTRHFCFSITLILFFQSALFQSANAESGRSNNAEKSDAAVHPDTLSPVIAGDFADPSIVKIGDIYYAAGTSSEWGPHYPVYRSTNLTDWKLVTYIFAKREAWMKSSFWAPELYYYNNRLYAYYTVRDTGNISCIGVATAETPEKGFTDHGVIIRTGNEAIDAFVFDDGGQRYITWKAYGLDKRPIELLSSKLSADGLKLEGETVSIKRDDARKGMEGQSMIKRNGFYYLFYSAGSCCGVPCDYNVRVSRSKSVTGPFEEYDANPILKENENWLCTGHGTPVQLNDGRWFYLYHAYEKEQNVYTGRQGLLAEITWDATTGWPAINRTAATAVSVPLKWRDDFDANKLALQWTWDYRYSAIKTSLENGVLKLSGVVKPENKSGTVLCLRPTTGNYEISTSVLSGGKSLKGLTLYGDDNSNTGIALSGKDIIVWETRDKVRKILSKIAINPGKSVVLKMTAKDGHLLSFSYSADLKKYNVVNLQDAEGKLFDATFTKQWDRSPRAGLIQQGSEPAAFEWFVMDSK